MAGKTEEAKEVLVSEVEDVVMDKKGIMPTTGMWKVNGSRARAWDGLVTYVLVFETEEKDVQPTKEMWEANDDVENFV